MGIINVKVYKLYTMLMLTNFWALFINQETFLNLAVIETIVSTNKCSPLKEQNLFFILINNIEKI